LNAVKTFVRALYTGADRRGRLFRFTLLAFDTVALIFFIASSLVRDAPWIHWVDAIIAVVIIADLAARLWIAPSPSRLFRQVTTYADLVVIVTLLAPTFLENFLFLRVLRAFRVFQSYRVLSDLREEFAWFRRHEDVIKSVVNLLVFIFVMSSVVFVLQEDTNPGISDYLDALYFTVGALTTTGFGDITLEGKIGQFLTILILLVGVGLFVRLVQAIFRPARVSVQCPECGLTRHDADAVHCKHCGQTINIETEGRD